jgi:hypothetical protein
MSADPELPRSDNTVDHAFAPSDRFTPAPFVRRNEMLLD